MAMNDMIQFFRQLSGKLGSNIYAGVHGQTNPQHISFIRQLQKEMQKDHSLTTPFLDLKVVVFDVETTGFYPERGDRVISIGAVKMTGPRIHENETFYSLVKTDIPLSDAVSVLTDIRNEDLQNAPEAPEVLIRFFKFIHHHVLVAHHAKHEQVFMKKMTHDLVKRKFDHRIIDTSFLTRITLPARKPLSLEEVCKECNIEIKGRHHALGDAMLTAQIWSHYIQLVQSMGMENLRELYQYLTTLE
ncbi:exonuclease domain-containing protein [Bacillus sp. FJAT-29814]|uniref:exonuclease domain-containing protein n=1 Tax=Bacillus sp. FJAT-29814 TaxID=1729688 RepID=UPI00082BD77A|nr:exonuclease domain-containing protein [Bacillus sp. FJAT-29814]